MNKLFSLTFTVIVFLLLYNPIAGQDWGTIRYVHSTTNIRSERTTESDIIGQLEKGQKIKADFLENNWYAVFPPKESERIIDESMGFVYAPLLKPSPPSNNSSSREVDENFKYDIIDKEDVSYQGASRMVYRVVVKVNQKPKESELKKVAKQIWKKHDKGWDEFTVFIYLPDMDTESTAYGIGEFRSYGLKNFSINKAAIVGTKWL